MSEARGIWLGRGGRGGRGTVRDVVRRTSSGPGEHWRTRRRGGRRQRWPRAKSSINQVARAGPGANVYAWQKEVWACGALASRGGHASQTPSMANQHFRERLEILGRTHLIDHGL